MATALEPIVDELQQSMRFYPTPIVYDRDDYRRFVKNGVSRLYNDMLWDNFDSDIYTEEVNGEQQYFLRRDLTNIQKEFVLIESEILFKEQVKEHVSALVGYTTDALSITKSDQPYRNLKDDIADLERRLVLLFFKMTMGGK
jgi:hypothetical protein